MNPGTCARTSVHGKQLSGGTTARTSCSFRKIVVYRLEAWPFKAAAMDAAIITLIGVRFVFFQGKYMDMTIITLID